MSELHFLSVAELGQRFRARAVSPVELVRSLLDRIARHDGRLHAFLTLAAPAALAQAELAEKELHAGIDRGPLHGIPFGLKDIINTAGLRTTAHSKLLADNVPSANAALVERLYRAGGVLLGKLATYEFALGGPSFDLPWAPALNPWSLDHLPGGSSSGAAAAVAAGFLPAAIGTDTGGSIRGPAAVCGIVGLKPSYGRVSRRGVLPNTFSMDHCGPLARCVEDCALLLQAIAGYDPADPTSADVPVPNYRACLGDDISGLRIGLVESWYAGSAAHPELGPAMQLAMRTLADLGAVVESVALPGLQEFGDCKTIISTAELYAIHALDLQLRPQDFGMALRSRVLPGALLRAESYVQAQRQRLVLCQALGAALSRYDLLATAGWPRPADPVAPAGLDGMGSLITAPFSVGGLPAIVLPCGFTAAGLPLSLQLAGRAFDEATVLRAAYAYEQATDWRRRHPDLDQLPAPRPLADEGQPKTSASADDLGAISAMARSAGLTLSQQHLAELAEIFPHYAAMAARLPREFVREDELAHVFDPNRSCAAKPE